MRTPLSEEAWPGALGGRLEKATGRELGGSVSKHDQKPRGQADRRLHGHAAAGLPAARAGCLAFIPADDPLKLSSVESISAAAAVKRALTLQKTGNSVGAIYNSFQLIEVFD